MKVLVYGSNGWIGGQFSDILTKNNIEYISGESRLTMRQHFGKKY